MRILFFLIIVPVFLSFLLFKDFKQANFEKTPTVVKIRYPKGITIASYPMELPHYFDPYNSHEYVKGELDKDGFYNCRINLDFPQSIKIGPRRILIIPTDTAIVDFTNKQALQSCKDSLIRSIDEMHNALQPSKLTGKVWSSGDYKILSPLEFKQRIDSFYKAGQDYIKDYLKKNPGMDPMLRYFAECDLLFKAGRQRNLYYDLNSQDSIRILSFPKDFLKYNSLISKNYNRLFFSESGYLFFNDYTISLMHTLNPYKDYETKLKWIYENTSGLVRDIVVGKTITEYQLRKFKEEYLPVSLKYAAKIRNENLKSTILSRIEEMKISQTLSNKEPNVQPENKITISSSENLKGILEHYYEKLIYVKFWATWCGPCLRDAEYLDDLDGMIKDQNFKILNICIQSPSITYKKLNASKPHFGDNLYLNDNEYAALAKEIIIPYPGFS